jgi:hypothetical protein
VIIKKMKQQMLTIPVRAWAKAASVRGRQEHMQIEEEG